jgi:hypothetical protein
MPLVVADVRVTLLPFWSLYLPGPLPTRNLFKRTPCLIASWGQGTWNMPQAWEFLAIADFHHSAAGVNRSAALSIQQLMAYPATQPSITWIVLSQRSAMAAL